MCWGCLREVGFLAFRFEGGEGWGVDFLFGRVMGLCGWEGVLGVCAAEDNAGFEGYKDLGWLDGAMGVRHVKIGLY